MAIEILQPAVTDMKLDLSWIPRQDSPFKTMFVQIPSRELRHLYRTELTKERGILFNTKLIEPPIQSAPLEGGIPCPSLSKVQGVLLDTLHSAQPAFFSQHLQLLGQAIGDAGSSGRSLRLVRHALQIANLFHSYLRMGCNPSDAADDNINKAWQVQLWTACLPEIHTRATQEAVAKKLADRAIEVSEIPFCENIEPLDSNKATAITWTTSANTRMELRHVASQILDQLTSRKISDLNKVAIVLPPRQTHEYAVQLSSIFTEEFKIPFNLHESLNNTGVGFAQAFVLVLELLKSDFRKADVLHLLKHDAFGILQAGDDDYFLETWAQKLGVVIGLESSDLVTTFIPEQDRKTRYHWLQAVDRLCLVALSVPNVEDPFGVPRGSLELVQRLTHFLLTLRTFRSTNLSAGRSLAGWASEFKILARAVFGEKVASGEASEQQEFDEVLRSVDSLAQVGSIAEAFDMDMAIELVRRPLSRARKRRSGGMYQRGVSVFALRSGSLLVPYSHVFLLGVEDGNVPRIDRIEGTHLFPEMALARSENPHNRDMRALKEMIFAHRERQIFISHVEKNIANGERKKPAYHLLALIDKELQISAAPLVRVGKEAEIDRLQPKAEFATDEAAFAKGPSELSTLGQKKIPVRAITDACSCPVVARAKYFLKVGENPLPEDLQIYPDAELSFFNSRIVVDQTMQAWMSDPSLSPDAVQELYKISLRHLGKDRAIPPSNRLEFGYKRMADIFPDWTTAGGEFRPARTFTFGRELTGTNAVVLPELRLQSGYLLTGRLPAMIHINEQGSCVTAVVTTASNFEEEAGFNLPIEPSCKAMISFCALRCIDPTTLSGNSREILLSFQKATRWQILLFSSFAGSKTSVRKKALAAWSEQKSENWVNMWIDLIHSPTAPDLFPYPILIEKLAEMKNTDDKIEYPKDTLSDIHHRLGRFPYDSRILLGNVILNHPLEPDPDAALRQRYPWIIS